VIARNRAVRWVTVSVVVGLILAGGLASAGPTPTARNIIIMVSDGAGYNTWQAAAMYEGRLGREVYDGPGWVAFGCSTFPLNRSKVPTGGGDQDAAVVYDPVKAWDNASDAQYRFGGYRFLKTTWTDSAAAATALAAGVKTYNSAINWTNDNQSLTGRTIAELAKARGKAVGVVTTVPWSHATPAGLGGAHNINRSNYEAIANEMLNAPYLDVIMGAGHPEFDDNGTARAKPSARYVGGPATWQALKKGTHPGGWTLVQTKAEFEALAAGPTPGKVLGVAQVASTLQQARGAYQATDTPDSAPRNENVPTLATMVRAALNVLDDDPDGFYLHIEGGAVDWANHGNQPARMIEEQLDFLRAVEAVTAWVQTHGGWGRTLLILTADHDCGLVWGPHSDTVPYEPIVDRGAGKMPALRYNSNSHTNSLVPVYAIGAGSSLFAEYAVRRDPVYGPYVDNTDLFRVMSRALAEPAAGRPPGPVPASSGSQISDSGARVSNPATRESPAGRELQPAR